MKRARPNASPWSGRGKSAATFAPSTAKPAPQILLRLDRYLVARGGDGQKLKPPGCRLPRGDYRLFFDLHGSRTIRVAAVGPKPIAKSQ